MNNYFTEEEPWQPLEGDQSWSQHEHDSCPKPAKDAALSPFPLELPLGGFGWEPTAPWPYTSPTPDYIQDTLEGGSSNIELQQNLFSGWFPVAEAEGHANPENVLVTSEPRGTVLPNVDTAMLYPGTTSHHQWQRLEQATDQSTPAIDFQFVSGSRPIQQNLVSGSFPVVEAEGHANPQNVLVTSEPRGTVLPNVDTAMLYPVYTQGTTSHYQWQQQEQATDQSTPASDFQFVSGSRPLQPLAAKAELSCVAQGQDENSEGPSLKCDFPGCPSKKTFRRKYELQRHMKKHTQQKRLDCPAVNCKFRGPKAFYRPDKLKAHVLAGHGEQTLFACPVAGCFSARTPLSSRAFLSVHIRNHSLGQYGGYLPALGSLDQVRTCPVESCLKKLSPYSLKGHVLQHTEAERAAYRIKIAAAGLDHLSGCVICPVISCRITLPDLPAFQDHLIDHIALAPNHFRAWRAKTRTTTLSTLWERDLHQRPWESRYGNLYFLQVDCPACGLRREQNAHPFDLLKDPMNLHACREEILQLYPGIGWHPIFDDVMPAVQRRRTREP
ncbi:hypothetical protein GJ744_002519 [Endocarpon pusillum]|uniref:C2H2-type domain-containing protein n=1 Tax=Endocarpon pusillum TaxID=364733 RepID=A0A8H7ABU1_9EURO|nr:hypothetical protein GJ744_002519 [Endocarpon pusillum]